MFRRTYTSYSTKNDNENDDIIVAIVTNNLTKLKLVLNNNNVNNIIDSKNNYTALHYAVTLPNNDITKYILELGADPKIKQNENYDAFELALRSGKKFIFEYYEENHKITIDSLKTNNTQLTIKTNNLKKDIEYLNDSIDKCNSKIITLNKVIENKDKEIVMLKRNLDESEQAFTNLLKKQKK
jgi:ankyrin repeat protein